MIEALDFYRQLDYRIVAALVFVLGLVIGSFTNVLYYRLPRRMSLSVPRSHCPSCGHTLGALDLVPVLSWLLLGRRCRYCKAPIPGRYPLIELGCGVLATAGALLAGWAGGFGAIALWLLGVWALAAAKRRELAREDGTSLVELLVAMALLMTVAVPLLELGIYTATGVEYRRKIAQTLATSKLEEWERQVYNSSDSSWTWTPPCDTKQVGAFHFSFDCPPPVKLGDWTGQATVAVHQLEYRNGTWQRPASGDKHALDVRMVAIIARSGYNEYACPDN